MPSDILEKHIRLYINEHPSGCGEVHFLWQGGEPTLMGIDFFRKAVKIQKQHMKPGVKISNSLQTNAVLIDGNWAKFLKDENFLVGVSLDGPPDLHDAYRMDKKKLATSNKVLRGLNILQNHDVDVNILTVVNKKNSQQPKTVYSYLKNIGATFLQFIPLLQVMNGKASNNSVNPQQFGHYLNGIFDEWIARKDVGKIFIQHFDLMLGIIMGYPPSLCTHCRTCGNGIVLEHNGDVYSCDHFVDSTHYLGNLQNSTYIDLLNSPLQIRFGQEKFSKLPGYCRRCKYIRFCYGGCPKDRISITSDGEQGLNYFCSGYKTFYLHTLPIFQKMDQSITSKIT